MAAKKLRLRQRDEELLGVRAAAALAKLLEGERKLSQADRADVQAPPGKTP